MLKLLLSVERARFIHLWISSYSPNETDCDIVIYKKYIFGLHPLSWHTAPKTLVITFLRATGTSLLYLVLFPVPEIATEHKGEMGIFCCS